RGERVWGARAVVARPGTRPAGPPAVLLAQPLVLDRPAQALRVENPGDLAVGVLLVEVADPANERPLRLIDEEVSPRARGRVLVGDEDRVIADRDKGRETLALPG